MKPTVYIADLRYNYNFLSNDCMPLGIAYLKAVMDPICRKSSPGFLPIRSIFWRP